MTGKKLPLRKCVACNAMRPKDELFRIVKDGNTAIIDFTYKAQSRGAYICKNAECIQIAEKKKSFNRSFKGNVSNEVIETLYKELANGDR